MTDERVVAMLIKMSAKQAMTSEYTANSWYNFTCEVVAHIQTNMLSFALRPALVPLPPVSGVLYWR